VHSQQVVYRAGLLLTILLPASIALLVSSLFTVLLCFAIASLNSGLPMASITALMM
jgi:hypothetical protein